MSEVAGALVPGAALEWSFNPWRERPASAWRALAGVAGCGGVVLLAGLPALAALALGLASGWLMAPALLPVRCRVDDQGVTRWSAAMIPERRPWADLRRAERAAAGVLLSPFGRRHWLDATRAIFLPVPEAGTGELAGELDRRLRQHGL